MSQTPNPARASPRQSRATPPSLVSAAPKESMSPVQSPKLLEDDTKGATMSEQSSDLRYVQEEPNSPDRKPDTQRRKSAIKYQDPESPQPKDSRPPPGDRRASTASVQSRYSEMTIDYSERIPAKYNTFAGFFAWILLVGFILGPGGQEIVNRTSGNPSSRGFLGRVSLLVISILCCTVGELGMIFLWIRWRRNYVWLIHKIFLPGVLNGLAGTLAVSINIWAIQGGVFVFSAATIISLSITLIPTVICLLLTFIYQLALLSVKEEHRQHLADAAQASSNAIPSLTKATTEQISSHANASV